MKLQFRLILVAAVVLIAVIATVALTSGGGEDNATKTASSSSGASTPASIKGPQLRMGDLVYNVADVRVLDHDSKSDAPYLVDVPNPPKGAGFLGVFLRVYNLGTKPLPSAAGYLLEPSKQPGLAEQDLGINNPYHFVTGETVPPGSVVPTPGSPAAAGKTAGAFLLYPIDGETLKDQPYDLVVHDANTGQLARIRLPEIKL